MLVCVSYVSVCAVFVVLLVASVLASMRWLLCVSDGSKKKEVIRPSFFFFQNHHMIIRLADLGVLGHFFNSLYLLIMSLSLFPHLSSLFSFLFFLSLCLYPSDVVLLLCVWCAVCVVRHAKKCEFSYTSSVITSLEFVFVNFRLTFGENLLFLSVQQSPNLCVSNV